MSTSCRVYYTAIVIVQLYSIIIIMLHRYTWLEADDWDTILSKDFPICFNSEVNQTLWMENFYTHSSVMFDNIVHYALS